MAIRVTHGKVGTFARFGIEAGKGEAKARAAGEAAATARSQAAAGAAVAAAGLRANAEIEKSINEAQARKGAMEFQSFMAGESAKRAIAWEQSKTEQKNQHDFDMLEQRRDMENQLVMDEELRERSKLTSKKQALTSAAERGEITQAEAQREILRLDVGAPPTYSSVFGRPATGEDALTKEIAKMVAQGGDVAPEQTNTATLLKLSQSPSLSPDDKSDIREIIASGNPREIRQALDILLAREESSRLSGSLGKAAAGRVITAAERAIRPVFGKFAVGP